MGRIDKPWGFEAQVLMTQIAVGDKTGLLGMRKLHIDKDEMTSYAVHEKQADIIYLEEGQVMLRIEGEMEKLENGKARVIRPGQQHQIQNMGEGVAEVLEISFPYRPGDIDRLEDPYSDQRSEAPELEDE